MPMVYSLRRRSIPLIPSVRSATQDVWISKLLDEPSVKQTDPTTIYCDNKSTIRPSKNPVLHGKSKHIDSKFPYFHDFMKNREINLEFCRSEEHVANS